MEMEQINNELSTINVKNETENKLNEASTYVRPVKSISAYTGLIKVPKAPVIPGKK